ncbi:hypothetical protein DMB92_05965 [Campylobacter sp. MIT 99-7217]|nr:hypothetical protein DMB92_05965 [Campylobacter sp. MIT 99-7217]
MEMKIIVEILAFIFSLIFMYVLCYFSLLFKSKKNIFALILFLSFLGLAHTYDNNYFLYFLAVLSLLHLYLSIIYIRNENFFKKFSNNLKAFKNKV